MCSQRVKKGYEVYTDGGVRGNDKKENLGAWAYVYLYKGKLTEKSGLVFDTSSDTMEMLAILEAMKNIENKSLPVRIYSDSSVCVNGLKKWVYLWEKAGWKKGKYIKNQVIYNLDLWRELHYLRNEFSDIIFIKVKSHSDCFGNAVADKIVNVTMNNYKLDRP